MKTYTLPQLIDPHVHLRDPGATDKEDFSTGTQAAVAGGITVVLDMPNNTVPTTTKKALNSKKAIAGKKAHSDWGLIFGASQHDNTKEFENVAFHVAALKVYMDTTTGDLLLEKLAVLEKTFKRWPAHKPIVVHAENGTLAKAIGLAAVYNKHLHIAHLSQRSELELVMDAKQKGMMVTCEVAPHHLFLTDKDAKALGPYGVMKPPLKSRSDVDFLWKHIDAIDAIATDHAPHTKNEKESETPPYGVTGVETSLPLMLTAVSDGRIEIADLIRLMHEGPAKIFGIPQTQDTYTIVELKKGTISNKRLFTKCGWSAYDGMSTGGRVIETTIRGKKVFDGEKILNKPGFGKDIYS